MINKKFLLILVLLVTFDSVFAFRGDPEVFQIFYNNRKLACAEIDEKYSTCWEQAVDGFLSLPTNQLEKQKLQPNTCSQGQGNDCLPNLEEATLYILTLLDLVEQLEQSPEHRKKQDLHAHEEMMQELQQNIYNASFRGTGTDPSTLEHLIFNRVLTYSYDSTNTKDCVSKIRAIGAAIYINYGHDGMVKICNSLPKLFGIRATVESFWDGIGRWRG